MWAPLWTETVLREYVGRVVASNQGNASECWQDDIFTPDFYPNLQRALGHSQVIIPLTGDKGHILQP